MQARVTVILVARNGAAYLGRTLAAVAAQTRRPDAIVAVDAGSADSSADSLAASAPTQLVTTRAQPFGSAVERALEVGPPPQSEDEWLWLLAHDNAPEPNALAELLAAVEISPSVAIAGPKLMRLDQPDVIAEFGETMTRYGSSALLVDGELDQAQHDVQDDALGVAANGMLVRRSVFSALGGFDPGLPSIDAALDFSIRARLAGYRVALVPGAKVSSAGPAETFGRRSVSGSRRARIARGAQLHRRLVYSPAAALPLHWLSLVPLAFFRAIGQILAKRPGSVGGEFGAAFASAFTGGVLGARRRIRRTRRVGWGAIAPLRMSPRDVRERRLQAREAANNAATTSAAPMEPVAGFVAHGGLWMVVLAAVIAAIALGPILSAQSLVGGGLLPLSGTPGELWSHVGYGWREIGGGFVGASDPFAYVLAVLGSITFWSPSFGVVLLYLLALPLSALGAWFAARRVSSRPWLPAIAALLWTLAPSLLSSLGGGHLGAVIAHLLLPWLVLAALGAPRSWAAAATSALLLAAIGASAPILVPALLVAWFAWLVSRPAAVLRLIAIPVPLAALFAPLVIQQIQRGNPLGLLAEPGVPVSGAETSAWQLALGSAAPGLDGWTGAASALSLPGAGAAIVVAALLLPVAALALLALFVPGSRRSIPSLVLALMGFATAVIGSRIDVAVTGASVASIWPGAALSLFWLGLIGAVLVALDAVGRAAIPLAVLASVTTVILAIPLLGAQYLPNPTVREGDGRILPAVVAAEADDHPAVGTLVLTPNAGGSLIAQLERGAGATLDDQSTLGSTATSLPRSGRSLADLAGNLASQSGLDTKKELAKFSIGFVVLTPADGHREVHQRASEALDGNPVLAAVGSTSSGLLWRVNEPGIATTAGQPSNVDSAWGRVVLIGQGIVFGLTLLLGIPTARRRRRTTVSGSTATAPATTFEEEDDNG
ncbi:glycosyltransferase family 2 protein [Lacisediminihabitans changchengi]|uniref:Glycosyltransferase family 2 protein n=1 Tax=Lacisediminihabitans changchengi TaxID=2787634 RepID=A0A934W235_9MICO|nr:glycosyltransferase family 2 protein [Lacisediminihabitans changchengi]MBK4346426.1 glycosyltransferase family 2 protein [Lacisediminihabitans changchengi]